LGGTASGAHELTGISGADANGIFNNSHYPDFTVFNGEVLFSGINAAGNAGLWVTDGTAAGTHEITGISGAFGARKDAQSLETGRTGDDHSGGGPIFKRQPDVFAD
jgi:ELWxxDGT repeat protein